MKSQLLAVKHTPKRQVAYIPLPLSHAGQSEACQTQETSQKKPQFFCLHINTANSVCDCLQPGRSFPKAQFSVTWNAVYMCSEGHSTKNWYVLRNICAHTHTHTNRQHIYSSNGHLRLSPKASCFPPSPMLKSPALQQYTTVFTAW